MITDNGFAPGWLLAAPGQPITFRNESEATWSVVFDHQNVRSGPIAPGATSRGPPRRRSASLPAGNAPKVRGKVQVQSVSAPSPLVDGSRAGGPAPGRGPAGCRRWSRPGDPGGGAGGRTNADARPTPTPTPTPEPTPTPTPTRPLRRSLSPPCSHPRTRSPAVEAVASTTMAMPTRTSPTRGNRTGTPTGPPHRGRSPPRRWIRWRPSSAPTAWPRARSPGRSTVHSSCKALRPGATPGTLPGTPAGLPPARGPGSVLCADGAPVLAAEPGRVEFGSNSLGGLVAVHPSARWWLPHYAQAYPRGGPAGTASRWEPGNVELGSCGASGDATVPHVHFGWYGPDGEARNPMEPAGRPVAHGRASAGVLGVDADPSIRIRSTGNEVGSESRHRGAAGGLGTGAARPRRQRVHPGRRSVRHDRGSVRRQPAGDRGRDRSSVLLSPPWPQRAAT